MNGVPMKFDYSKSINEQLPTFEYYRNRYISYELQIMELQQENKKLREKYKATNKGLIKVLSKRLKWKRRYYKEKYIRKELKKYIEDRRICTIYDDFCRQILDKIKELEEGVKE